MKKINRIAFIFLVVFGIGAFGVAVHAQSINSSTSTVASSTAVTFSMASRITITPSALPDATLGIPYMQNLSVSTELQGPFTWSLYAGALPDGLTLGPTSTDGVTGNTIQISGTPTAATSSNFAVSVTNHSIAALQSFTLNTDAASMPLPASTATIPASTSPQQVQPVATSSAAPAMPQSVPAPQVTQVTQGTSAADLEAEIASITAELQQLESGVAGGTATPSNNGTTGTSVGVSNGATSGFSRDLSLGDSGPDVLALQQFLNGAGYPIAATGPGSSGNETQHFGSLTQTALMSWQSAMGIAPASGFFGPISRSKISSGGSAAVNSAAPGTQAPMIPAPAPSPAPVSPSVPVQSVAPQSNQSAGSAAPAAPAPTAPSGY
jgi:hypothetical protein